jgi:hypothetical protein
MTADEAVVTAKRLGSLAKTAGDARSQAERDFENATRREKGVLKDAEDAQLAADKAAAKANDDHLPERTVTRYLSTLEKRKVNTVEELAKMLHEGGANRALTLEIPEDDTQTLRRKIYEGRLGPAKIKSFIVDAGVASAEVNPCLRALDSLHIKTASDLLRFAESADYETKLPPELKRTDGLLIGELIEKGGFGPTDLDIALSKAGVSCACRRAAHAEELRNHKVTTAEELASAISQRRCARMFFFVPSFVSL